MIEHRRSSSARTLRRLLASLQVRERRPSTGDVLSAGYIAHDRKSSHPPFFPYDPGPAASTELLNCIAELERMAADLKKIVRRTGGAVGNSLREQHYELEAVVHRIARNASS